MLSPRPGERRGESLSEKEGPWRRRRPTASPGVEWTGKDSCRQERIPVDRKGSCRQERDPVDRNAFLIPVDRNAFLSTGMDSCRQERIPVDSMWRVSTRGCQTSCRQDRQECHSCHRIDRNGQESRQDRQEWTGKPTGMAGMAFLSAGMHCDKKCSPGLAGGRRRRHGHVHIWTRNVPPLHPMTTLHQHPPVSSNNPGHPRSLCHPITTPHPLLASFNNSPLLGESYVKRRLATATWQLQHRGNSTLRKRSSA